MAIKPILFNKQISTEMVRAILDGRKTCTRRLVKFLPGENSQWTGYIKDGLMLYNGRNEPCIRKVPYQLGDILYVRETWCGLPVNEAGHMRGHTIYYYKADGELRPKGWRGTWHPSIHMPKEAARIWLKVSCSFFSLSILSSYRLRRLFLNFSYSRTSIIHLPPPDVFHANFCPGT